MSKAAVPTKRLYFDDAYRMDFEASILERLTCLDHPAVVLDATAFYPESGGQPWDLGTLGGVPVIKVVEEGDRIVHVLERDVPGGRAEGRIDAVRRFDHMQQHSGQHILSQAFIEVVQGETRSFHLGADVSTLEIGIPAISKDDRDKVERRANEVVFQDRDIRTFFVPRERIAEVPLRRPPQVEGTVRVVEVCGFDYSACGGTHVRRTGEIGLIKMIGWEKIRGNLRFVFVCGGRALADYRKKTDVTRELAARFDGADQDIPGAVEKLSAELKAARKRLKGFEEEAAAAEARTILARSGGRVLTRVFENRSPDSLRALALNLIREGERVVLLAARGDTRAHLVLARSETIPLDLRTLVGRVAPLLDGKGGGGPSLVEIAGRRDSDLDAVLAAAEAMLSF